jgi:membrane fusion protein, multidrug efflux system
MNGSYTRSRRILPAIGAALLFLGVAGCAKESADAAEGGAVEVVLAAQDLAVATSTSLNSVVVLTGSLNPYLQVEVKAQVPGVVSRIAADRGDDVREGAPLARIEAEGITSQASSAQSAVAASEANVALARRQLASSLRLYEAGALSEIDYRTAQVQVEAAESQLSSARAQAAAAGEQAARTTVQAPITGEVNERLVNEGEVVSVGQTLFTVVNSQFLELEGQVPVDEAARVREGQTVVFALDAYPGREFRGTVSRVAPVANPGTRQVAVVMRLPNPDWSLIGGLFATGQVITGSVDEAVVVPEAAVRGSDGDRYVLVVENDFVVRRPVTVGLHQGARGVVALESGIQSGERVLVAPGAVPEGAAVRFAAEVAAEVSVPAVGKE